MRDIADDCQAAFVHCDVFHPDGLLTSGSVSLEGRDLRRVGTARALRAVLLRNIVHMIEPALGHLVVCYREVIRSRRSKKFTSVAAPFYRRALE